MGRKVTAADVAREAGVSPATVDRVLNARGGVAEDKEKRVLAAARRLGLDRALDLKSARTLRVAAFIQSQVNPFHATLQAAISAANKGPNPYNMQTRVFHIAPDAPQNALGALRRAAADHDGFIICLPDDDALANFAETLAQSGKPVVTLATDIGAPSVTYVGPDNYRSGRITGDLVGRLLGRDGGEVFVVSGLLSMTGQSERRRGFADVLCERFPACRIIELCESGENGALAGQLVADALTRHPDLRAIYNSSAGVRPVAEALRQFGHEEDIVFVTHELTDARRALLLEGALDAVIDQEPSREIQIALDVIAKAYDRLDLDVETETPVRIFLRENC